MKVPKLVISAAYIVPVLIRSLVSSSSKEPVFMVPSCANPDFVGREKTFHQLDGLLRPNSGGQRRAALHGLGGTG